MIETAVVAALRSPTVRRWIGAAVAGVLALVIGLTFFLFALVGGSSGTAVTMAAAAENCTPGGAGQVVYDSPGGGKARLPVVGTYSYTSPFGNRLHPIYGTYRMHAGMDLVTGGGDVVAPMDGTVQSIILGDPGAGNFIVLEHGGGISTRYLHLASTSVKRGQKVSMGQKIGVEGSTGGSTGPHLHFEVLRNGTPTDPAAWLKGKGVKVAPLDGQGTAPAKEQGSASTEAAAQAATDDSSSTAKGGGFDLPKPGSERKNSTATKPMSIPPKIKKLYQEAGDKYGVPWELLAGVGMEETHHGRIKDVSYAGAMGHMQFMPATWASDLSVDGDGDGQKDILNTADSIHSAANKLSQEGATESPEGVKRAILAYNQATWYVNDVLYYAHQYAGGAGVAVTGSGGGGDDCGRVDVQLASTTTTDCPASNSPAEKGLRPNALNGLRCIAKTAPWVQTYHGVGERAGKTEHDDGLAVDAMIPKHDTPAGNKRGWKLAHWLQANAEKLGITYLIYDSKIWSVERRAEGWRAYTRYGDTPDDTLSHRDHVHASFEDAAQAEG